ncbi:hypothetical protein Acr_09g0005640 [Actinidia rufa]|uniref:Uncharacterized protein n=1 Tax=Actinidia rufa TaxID=165716 RepID=A0A7J0F5X8_9ERIC|nr:hypothetical protein Acr_09g0005640 [Actinidia rufa]
MVRGIQSGVGSTDQQACTPGEEGVLSYQSLRHLAELRTRLAMRPRDVGDHLTEMIELMGVATNALIRQTKPPFTERGMRVKSLVQIQVAISARSVRREDISHGPPGLVQELDNALGDREILKDYVKHFNQVVLEVEDPSNKVVVMAMMEGLRPGPLFDSISKSVLETLSALHSKANKYIAAEETRKERQQKEGA